VPGLIDPSKHESEYSIVGCVSDGGEQARYTKLVSSRSVARGSTVRSTRMLGRYGTSLQLCDGISSSLEYSLTLPLFSILPTSGSTPLRSLKSSKPPSSSPPSPNTQSCVKTRHVVKASPGTEIKAPPKSHCCSSAYIRQPTSTLQTRR